MHPTHAGTPLTTTPSFQVSASLRSERLNKRLWEALPRINVALFLGRLEYIR